MPQYLTKADRRRAHKHAAQAKQRLIERANRHRNAEGSPIISLIAHQPDDRPQNSNLPKSHSWISVPAQVVYTDRRTEKLSYMDEVTARFANSYADLTPSSKR